MKKLLLLAFVLVAVAACGPSEREEPLIFVATPEESVTMTQQRWEMLIEYLSDELGRPVELAVVTDYAATIRALELGWADVAHLGAISFIRAYDATGGMFEVIASYADEDGGKSTYQSYIITRADSGVTDLNGVTHAFTDLNSTSGYVIPHNYMEMNGIEIGEEYLAGTHEASLEAVLAGMVDTGSCSSRSYQRAMDAGIFEEGELVILWESGPVPSGPMTVRKDMPQAEKEALQKAFVKCPLEVIHTYNSAVFGFVVHTNEDYEVIRELGLDK